MAATAFVAITILLIPFSSFAHALGFIRPPIKLIGVTILITAVYGIAMEMVKQVFFRRLPKAE